MYIYISYGKNCNINHLNYIRQALNIRRNNANIKFLYYALINGFLDVITFKIPNLSSKNIYSNFIYPHIKHNNIANNI